MSGFVIGKFQSKCNRDQFIPQWCFLPGKDLVDIGPVFEDEGNFVPVAAGYAEDAYYIGDTAFNHEILATIRDDMQGEGIYTLCLEDSSVLYIKFYQDNAGNYCADIQGLDIIYTNAAQIETYIMTEQYIP